MEDWGRDLAMLRFAALQSLVALLAAAGVVACESSLDDSTKKDGDDDTNGSGGGGSQVAEADGWPVFKASQAFQLRRLTTEQYVTSATTLLGVSADGLPETEPVSPVGGFPAIGASTASVSGQGVGQFEDAARFLAQAAFGETGPRATLSGCTPASVSDSACFESFATAFGQRAFRRPLGADEIQSYVALATQVATAANDVWQGLEYMTSAFLQSPHFLYLPEVGEPDPTDSSRYRYTAYEMASRLAYFLTNNTPDDELLAAAASGSLVTTDGIQAQTARLLTLQLAHDSVGNFFSTMLQLGELDEFFRPVEVYPQFSPTLGASMKQETLLTIDDLVFTENGDYRHLFDQSETFVNAELAAIYGVTAPAGGGFERVTLPSTTGRVGLLGQAGVLAARDHSDGTSPIKRGLFIMTRLLCQDLPLMPPANLEIPMPPEGVMTARQRLEQHSTEAVCASCHDNMDPVGLALEHFDAMGAYRETDNGLPIDDSGRIGDIEFDGLPGLGAVLRDHPALGPCLIQAFYGVSVGHLPTDFDHDTYASLVSDFDSNGARIQSLMTTVTSSDGFRYFPVPN
jgi:hypothetical protein